MAHTQNISAPMPALPKSWSELTWQQLCDCWQVKMRYGGNADVARAAAVMKLCGLSLIGTSGLRHNVIKTDRYDDTTGEPLYLLRSADGRRWSATARELSHLAKACLGWFDFPYGDTGKEAVKDEKGKVIEEAVAPVRGYVSGMHDAMILPQDEVEVSSFKFHVPGWCRRFYLPRMAMNNLTWQQYRSLQAIAPQLFAEGTTDEQALDLQAQFLAHCLVPRSIALLDTTGGSIRLRPHYEYRYNVEQAERMVKWWKKRLTAASSSRHNDITTLRRNPAAILFHICFQCYQTAIGYYATTYPLLFNGENKGDTMNDALQGEVGTINAVMMKANYANQQDVYDSNLPFILDILNTMAKEAKEIEKMNARIKRR